MKKNSAMEAKWKLLNIDDAKKEIKLSKKLENLAGSPFTHIYDDTLVLKALTSKSIKLKDFPDRTGYEAFVNHIHINDFIDKNKAASDIQYILSQAVLYAEKIKCRLMEIDGTYRILLSLDIESNEVTVRFYKLRSREELVSDDLEKYTEEGMILWET